MSTNRSILETPQQLLLGLNVSPEVEYVLGRACTAHSFAAAKELIGDSYTTDSDELISLVLENGAGSGSVYYREGVGWNIIALADLLRKDGFPVISQNIRYDKYSGNFDQAVQVGRVRTEFEKSRLNLLMDYGGANCMRWLEAIYSTTLFLGVVVVSVSIPLLDGSGYGPHAVVVAGIDDQHNTVTYFDADMYCIQRYEPREPDIVRVDKEVLLYQRSVNDFVGQMTGEITHILPPCK